MGSTGTHIERGQKMADVALSGLSNKVEVLKHVTRRTSGEWQYAMYAAIRIKESGEVTALVVLMHRNPSPSVYENFYYKYVDESMGPNESDCPASILNLLTPIEASFALIWRDRCRANLANPPAKVSQGGTVTFTRSLRFGDGVEETRFEYLGRTTFKRKSDGRMVRIPNWRKNYAYEVAAA